MEATDASVSEAGIDLPPAALRPLVEVIGRGFVARGRLLEAHGRVSDHLNERRSMIFLADCELRGLAEFPVTGRAIGINRDDIVVVVPLEESLIQADSALRVDKERVFVRLLVDGWRIQGLVSLVPGVSLERFVNVGHESFIPLVDASLVGAHDERTVPVALVRRGAIRLLAPG